MIASACYGCHTAPNAYDQKMPQRKCEKYVKKNQTTCLCLYCMLCECLFVFPFRIALLRSTTWLTFSRIGLSERYIASNSFVVFPSPCLFVIQPSRIKINNYYFNTHIIDMHTTQSDGWNGCSHQIYHKTQRAYRFTHAHGVHDQDAERSDIEAILAWWNTSSNQPKFSLFWGHKFWIHDFFCYSFIWVSNFTVTSVAVCVLVIQN